MIATTFTIAYGFSEGPLHSQQLVNALQIAGFKQTNNLNADIVIAHSAGCYLLPSSKVQRRLVLLIGPPYWPGKSLLVCLLQKLIGDARVSFKRKNSLYLLLKTFHATANILSSPIKSYQAYRLSTQHQLFDSLTNNPTIIVRNKQDTFCTPTIKQLATDYPHITFYELPGQHDDCWIYPDTIVSILKEALQEAVVSSH